MQATKDHIEVEDSQHPAGNSARPILITLRGIDALWDIEMAHIIMATTRNLMYRIGRMNCADDPESPFWRLPQELRDEIFELAYFREEPLKVFCKAQYGSRHPFSRTLSLSSLKSPLVDFAVSKRYYVEAKSSFFRHTTLQFEDSWHLSDFLQGSRREYAPLIRTLVLEKWKPSDSPRCGNALARCYNLRNICVKLESISFTFAIRDNEDEDVDSVRDSFDEALAKVREKALEDSDFDKVKGVRHIIYAINADFKLEAVLDSFGSTPQRDIQWQANVRAFENYVKGKISEWRENPLADKQMAADVSLVDAVTRFWSIFPGYITLLGLILLIAMLYVDGKKADQKRLAEHSSVLGWSEIHGSDNRPTADTLRWIQEQPLVVLRWVFETRKKMDDYETEIARLQREIEHLKEVEGWRQ